MTVHNLHFYWNPFFQAFKPIYYDGDVLFKNLNKTKNDNSYEKLALNIYYYSNNTYDRIETFLSSINVTNMTADIRKLAYAVSKQKINDILKTMRNNIPLHKKFIEERPPAHPRRRSENYDKRIWEALPTAQLARSLYKEKENNTVNQFKICNQKHCESSEFSLNEIADLISAESLQQKDPVFFSRQNFIGTFHR